MLRWVQAEQAPLLWVQAEEAALRHVLRCGCRRWSLRC